MPWAGEPHATRQPSGGDAGASSVEYGVILFGLAALLAVVLFDFGAVVVDLFSSSSEEKAEAAPAQTCV